MANETVPVFRVENGERVRVPGDVRDPNRRYHAVGGENGTYHLEFTEEEERQRDQEEAEWEALAPEREAERKRQERDAKHFRDSLRYETRVVAFLDVLGWSQAIAASEKSADIVQQLGVAMAGLNSHVEMSRWQRRHGGPDGWPGDPMITHFSDSLLISFRADEHAKSCLEWTLSSVIQQMLFNGFVVRGAVCCGPMLHRESLAYGPALIAAYKLERDAALWPRVILEPTLGQLWEEGAPVLSQNGATLGHHKPWRCFEDNWLFFDYLGLHQRLFDADPKEFANSMNGIFMPKWRKLIGEKLLEHANTASISAKYAWLARYFNKTCEENPGAGFNPIEVSC